eukprot:jgi/Hompol1/4649/HPOL_003802-RA
MVHSSSLPVALKPRIIFLMAVGFFALAYTLIALLETIDEPSSVSRKAPSSCDSLVEVNAQATPVNIAIVLSLSDDPIRKAELRASLNSLFYFRSCPINIHAIVKDPVSRNMVESWLLSHKPPSTTVKYIMDPPITIKNGFRSKFAGIKVVPDSVLPTSVDRVVIADFDLIWAADICDMFAEFDAFDS